MRINFRQGVVSHQETGFLEPNGSGGVRIAASTRSTTITLAHHDTDYTHSEDNNVENAWQGPFPAGKNYYLYWDFNQLTYLRTFGYTTIEPVSQSVPPGHGNSPIVAAVPGVASPVAYGSFEVQGQYTLAAGKQFAVVGSTGSPNNDGVYTVQSATYDLVTGNTTILVNEAVATSTVSGELTLDIDSKGLPLFVNGRHWYDTANHVHYVLNDSNEWVEVLRVFAANLFNGTTFLSMSQSGSGIFTGTQIGDNSSVASGRVLFGDAGNPIRRDDNTFFTTEDQFFTNQSRVDAIRLESNVSRAQAYSSSLAQFGIVAWRDDGKIASATYDDTGSTVVGVLTESILVGQVGAVITQGTVTNPAWNWTASLNVGAPLWILDGELVGIDPHVSDIATYNTKQVPVARVLSIDTIIFEQGLGGVGPQGPIGTITDLPLATTSEAGIAYLSHDATNPLLPIVVGENHPVITSGPYSPLAHTHAASQISFTPGNNIAASDVQNAIAELAIEKLNLSGGTMSGFLTLGNTPTNDFHATTKQYVDALFQGLDAKEASLVGTTELLGDIGGLYSSIGGTGGTGAITDALISKLDGTLGVDFTLAVDARILVKDQTDAKQNGIYTVTAIGTGSPPTTFNIERASDFDSNDEIRAGNYTVIRAGATQAGQGWVLTDIHPTDDIELNSHDITWTLVSSAVSYFGSSTIDIDGSFVISVKPNTVAALTATTATNATQWNTETITIAGSPSTGQSLVYNATTSTWENGTPPSDICDLVVTCLPASDTITSTKETFALNIDSNTGLSINTTPTIPASGWDMSSFASADIGTFRPDTLSEFAYSAIGGTMEPDGTVLTVIYSQSNGFYNDQFPLTIPYDISSATAVGYTGFNYPDDDGYFSGSFPTGLYFAPDGLSVFIITSNRQVHEYALDIAYDMDSLTGWTGPGGVTVPTAQSTPIDTPSPVESTLYHTNDGINYYFLSYDNDTVHHYAASIAWDVTSIVVSETQELATDGFTSTTNSSIVVSDDGTKMWAMATGPDMYEWTLSTPFDVTSKVYVGIIANNILNATPGKVFWSESGANMYYLTPLSGTADTFHQYNTGNAGSAGSTYTSLHFDDTSMLSTTADGVEVTGILSFAAEGSPTTTPQIVLPNYTTAGLPTTTLEGGLVYDADVNRVKFYDGVSWVDPHAAAVTTLDDLSDVIVGSPPTTNDILTYNGANWVNQAPSVIAELNDLTDVVVGSPPTTNDILTYNGANWINQAPSVNKPSYERFNIAGSPVSQVLNTTVSTVATGGSPIATSSMQVFRNGILQNEGDVFGSPITNDFEVSGPNQITFAPGSLQDGGVVIIYVFN